MEIGELTTLLLNSGTAIACIAFFMYRDLRFMSQLQTTLNTLVNTVNALKEITLKEGEKNGN